MEAPTITPVVAGVVPEQSVKHLQRQITARLVRAGLVCSPTLMETITTILVVVVVVVTNLETAVETAVLAAAVVDQPRLAQGELEVALQGTVVKQVAPLVVVPTYPPEAQTLAVAVALDMSLFLEPLATAALAL
jgi:hypothetical protein